MKRIFIFIICVIAACSCTKKADELVILHINDTHSHLDPLRDNTGGVLERAAFVDSVRKADGAENVLLLHAGDFSQGTSYFTVLKGDLEIDLINAMGYDCICLGNHELDNGIEELARRLSSLNCPVVCSNYDFSAFELGEYIKPYAVLEKAGMKIGIVGALNDITRSVSRTIADRLPKLDVFEEVNKWAKYLKEEESCDIVILLSHLGLNTEEDKVSDDDLIKTSTDIDVVVGGHSHTNLNEMLVVKNADGKDIPIVQDWCWGHQMGVLKVKRN